MAPRLRRLTAAGTAIATAALGLTLVGTSTASAAGPTHPFPTHAAYKVGVMPSASQASRDAAVQKQYDSWKANYLVHGCASNEYYVSTKGDGDAPNNGPVSEGQGYGMNIVPLMAGYDPNAQAEFNGLWQLVKDHKDQYGLMQWKLDGKTCKYADSGTPDGATDGDLDIGYGLILADRQWGGYTADAKAWLAAFYAHDVAPDGHLKAEDDGPNNDTRPSDFMLDHLRAFAAYDTAHDWNKVVTRTEAVISEFTHAYSATGGLLSDFVVNADTTSPKPAPADYQESQPDNIVGYNSIRVPWHLGTDALLYGSSTAAVSTATAKLESTCLKGESGGNPQKVYPHTKLNCTPYSTSDQAEEAGDSVGPSAMAAGDQAWTDAIWAQLATNPFGDGYFGESIKTLVYLVMSGDYWNPSAQTAPADDFSLSANPASGAVNAGGSASATVGTAVTSGSAQSVALAASGAPAGVTVSFSPSSVTAGSSSTMTVSTTSSAAAGSYPITVTGTAASGSRTAAYTLTVNGSTASGGSFEAESAANTRTGRAVAIACAACSGGSRVGYIGTTSSGTGTLTVNGVSVNSAGSYQVTVDYTNGSSAARTAAISVNGGTAQTVSFAPTGAFTTPGTTTVTLALAAGANTIAFANPSGSAADIDRIVVPGSPS